MEVLIDRRNETSDSITLNSHRVGWSSVGENMSIDPGWQAGLAVGQKGPSHQAFVLLKGLPPPTIDKSKRKKKNVGK